MQMYTALPITMTRRSEIPLGTDPHCGSVPWLASEIPPAMRYQVVHSNAIDRILLRNSLGRVQNDSSK